MKTIRVEDIMWPLKEGISLYPYVTYGDKVSSAVELMAKNNLNTIVVLKNSRPIGILHLKDALKNLGLNL